MDSLLDALQWLANFFGSAGDSIVGMVKGFWSWALGKLLISWLELKLWLLSMAWDFARGFLEGLGAFDLVLDAFSALPESAGKLARALGIPKCVNLLAQAGVTRFVLRLLPFA